MKILACVFMAWPLFAHAQGTAAPGQPAAIRSIPDEAFQRWIREDNKLIEGILGSLTHIDALLGDIERMIRQIPDFAPPAAVQPAPPPAPVVIEKTVIQEVPGPLAGWPPTLAGAAVLALLAFWLGRKQGATGQPAATGKGPAAAARQPKPALEKRAAAPPPAPAAAPAPAAPLPKPDDAVPALKFEPPSEQPAFAPPIPAPVEAFEPVPSIEASSPAQGDQALELAEIMLSMGLGHGATQTLTEQIRNEPKQALRHWLKLLDIYRRNGQQVEFERSAEELRLHFNVRPEDWHAQPGAPQSLESFPHIAKRLTELWGKPDCLVYMQNLLDDNRGGARSGFPQSVAEELLLLTAVMREAFGFVVSG